MKVALSTAFLAAIKKSVSINNEDRLPIPRSRAEYSDTALPGSLTCIFCQAGFLAYPSTPGSAFSQSASRICNGFMEPDSWLTVTGSPKNLTSFPLVLGEDCLNHGNSMSGPALDRLKFPLIIYHNNSRNAIPQ